MEVLRLGGQIRAAAEAYASATAILTALRRARNQTHILVETTSGPKPTEPQWELHEKYFLKSMSYSSVSCNICLIYSILERDFYNPLLKEAGN